METRPFFFFLNLFEEGDTMARLIDADALNKELQKRVGSPTDDKLYEVNLCIINAPHHRRYPGGVAGSADKAIHRRCKRYRQDCYKRDY